MQSDLTSFSDRDRAGYEEHADRLEHCRRFCQAAYGVDLALSSTAALEKLPAAAGASGQRARVTLTYAQSSDGKIAGPAKRMLALSNAESMLMTHSLRVLHAGIMVGIGTLQNDNPQLNARLLSPLLDGTADGQVPLEWLPRPIVLDGTLQTPLDCKLLLNWNTGKGKRPLIVTRHPVGDATKAEALQKAGAEIVQVQSDESGRLSWPSVLTTLRQQCAIESVMIEGGATVIESLLKASDGESEPLIDDLIITVSPQFVGESGLGYRAPSWLAKSLETQQKDQKALFSRQSYPFKGDDVIVFSSSAR